MRWWCVVGDRSFARRTAAVARRPGARPVRVGQLAFGVAFLLAGIGWFAGERGVAIGTPWVVALTCVAAGLTGLWLALAAIRPRR